MNNVAEDLRHIVEGAAERLLAISESRSRLSNVDGQWSAKQVLGHLIDSAANNHQRFVRAQFTDDLVFPGYDQEQWIRVQHYEEESWSALRARSPARHSTHGPVRSNAVLLLACLPL